MSDSKLPNQGIADQTTNRIRGYLFGGTGMSDEDTRLDTDLQKAGLIAYKNTASNAPNAAPEQYLSGTFFRGNGTTESAINAIRHRLQEMQGTQRARREIAFGSVARPGAKEKLPGGAPAKPKNKPAPTKAAPDGDAETPGWEAPPKPATGTKRVKLPGGAVRTATPAQIAAMRADGLAIEEVE
jgi:hypothetical protein